MRVIILLVLTIAVPSAANTGDEVFQKNLLNMAASCSARYLISLDNTSDTEVLKAYRFRADWMRRFYVALPEGEAGDVDESINELRTFFLSDSYQESTTPEERETEIWRCDEFMRNFYEHVDKQKE